MSDCYIYNVYKPKIQHLPCDFEAKFRYVHKVATKILDRFTEQQLIDATRRMDQAVLDSGDYWCVDSIDVWMDPDDTEGYSDSKEAFLHKSMMQKRDMSCLLGLERVTWAECYAIGAISLIAYAYRVEVYQCKQVNQRAEKARLGIKTEDEIMLEEFAKEVGSTRTPEMDAQISELWSMAEYAVESSKLAAIALTLSASLFSDEDYKSLLKRQTSKGGQRRAQRFQVLKRLVLQRYHAEHSHRSNRDAAKRIYKALTQDELTAADGGSVLTTDDPVKRLAEWIGTDKSSREKGLNE